MALLLWISLMVHWVWLVILQSSKVPGCWIRGCWDKNWNMCHHWCCCTSMARKIWWWISLPVPLAANPSGPVTMTAIYSHCYILFFHCQHRNLQQFHIQCSFCTDNFHTVDGRFYCERVAPTTESRPLSWQNWKSYCLPLEVDHHILQDTDYETWSWVLMGFAGAIHTRCYGCKCQVRSGTVVTAITAIGKVHPWTLGLFKQKL